MLSIAATNAPTAVPKMNPAVPVAPDLGKPAAVADAVAPGAVKPMTPAKPGAMEPGSPAITEPGSAAELRGRLGALQDKDKNPWGSPNNHPGFLGKLAHIAAKIGNVAGDIVDPGAMALIPGTELNRKVTEGNLRRGIGEAQTRETAEEAVKQRPEIAEATGALKERLEEEKENAAQKKEESREGSQETIAGTKTGSAEKIAGGKEASAEKISGGKNETAKSIADENIKSREQQLEERIASNERIATGRNLAGTEIARIRAAGANDPNKLTNTMKTMKQQAQSTLPGIDRALDETEKVAAELGPTEGRWNDFWQGKVGAENKEFSHYKDEIAFISTAVTLAHARGRMSNELFEHFQKMFDVGKQAPENMIQALNVAKEWLTEYANLGEPAPAAATPPAATPPAAPAAHPGSLEQPALNATRVNKKTGEEQKWDGKQWQTTKKPGA